MPLDTERTSPGASQVTTLVSSETSVIATNSGTARLFEREYLLTQIDRFGGNISRTARFVGMERSALHRKLKSLEIVGIKKVMAD